MSNLAQQQAGLGSGSAVLAGGATMLSNGNGAAAASDSRFLDNPPSAATAPYPTSNSNNSSISIAVPLSVVLSVALPECIRARGSDPRR